MLEEMVVPQPPSAANVRAHAVSGTKGEAIGSFSQTLIISTDAK